MDAPIESNEFSSLIEDLLNEDDKYSKMLHEEKDAAASTEDNDIMHTNNKKASDVLDQLSVKDTKDSSLSQKLWCHWLQRDFVRNTAILAILFVLITSPFFLSICHVYVPFTVTNESYSYSLIGSFMIGTLYAIICAFLMF